jgi:hypothetical protein
MTELILKNDIDKRKMEALISFLKSWGIDAELKTTNQSAAKKGVKFSLSAGLWKDYPISGEKLRKQAWDQHFLARRKAAIGLIHSLDLSIFV